MTGDSIASLVYLVLLVSVLGGYFLIANRQSAGTTARHATLWGLIFLGLIAGFGLWSDIRDDVVPRQTVFADEGRIEIPKSPDGHFYITATLNDTPVRFVVDTGATDIVLSQSDANAVGIDMSRLIFSGRASTANGLVETAVTEIDRFAVEEIVDRDVRVWVNRGEMDGSLLGMAYISRFDRFEISGNRLVLER
ncbi:MAG: TIGR02281 family clan AA aspartic protease [Pseudomonadota bacterium]